MKRRPTSDASAVHGQRIVLVRHGLTDWNESGRLIGRLPIGLNERGRKQAEALGEALAGVPLHAVHSSPQQRTRETAAAIAERHGLDVLVEPALDEVWLGRWQGKTYEEIRDDKDLAPLLADPTYVCDAIEPAGQVQSRVVALVERLRRTPTEKPLVLVSHGDPLRILVASHLDMPLREYRRLTIDPGSANVLCFDGRGVHLSALNWKATQGSLRRLLL